MKYKNEIPDPRVKNAILASKRIVKQHENKTTSKEVNTDEITEEIIMIVEEVLKDYGFLENEINDFLRVRNRVERDFENRKEFSEQTVLTLTGKRKSGKQYAEDTLIQQTVEILPTGFILPAGPEGIPKKRDDLIRFHAKRGAAEVTVRLVALALKEYAGYGVYQIPRSAEEIKERYLRLKEKQAEDLKE